MLQDREYFLTYYSDYHKEAYGFRPRFDYYSFSTEQLQADFERFGKVCKENSIEALYELQSNISAFEEQIKKTILLGASDRKTALKWLFEGEDLEIHTQDFEYFLWKKGFSQYDEYGKKLLNMLEEVYP